jgi:LysR family glycine cleavage system transcriptional activator
LIKMRHSWTPTLNELQAFRACAETGSATQAAQKLGLTQSAVSRSLATLEARLGVRLFHRVRQRLVLSDAGRAILRDAGRILDDLDQAAMTVMSFGGRKDVLRLAVLASFGTVWLIPRLARFQSMAPQVSVDITSVIGVVDFDRSPFDAAVQRGSLCSPGTEVLPLIEERLVVVAGPGLLPDGVSVLADAALAQLPLLQQSTRPDLWLNWFLEAGLDPITLLRGARFEHFGMIIAAAKANLGIALVPEILVAEDLALGRLRLASARSIAGPSPYALIWPAGRRESRALRLFRDWIQVELASES